MAFAVPGDLATPTGGYVYDRRIIAELDALGWTVDALNIGDGFPWPTEEARAAARRQLAAVANGSPIVVDGLAFGVLPHEASALRVRHRLVALVHHPLALESGLSRGEAEAFRASEHAALACADRVIATSAATARILRDDYDVPAERLSVVRPGTDRVVAPQRCGDAEVALLAVGAVVPRKGYDVLIATLAELTDLPWRLVVVGDRTRSPETARGLDADVARLGLTDRVSVTGAVAPGRLAALYASADLFVLPSRFEGYGMALSEAIAHGVPVVATSTGAVPETVPAGAGVLVPPDDAEAFASALRRLIASAAERTTLAAGARAAAASFPSWRESATLFSEILEQVRDPALDATRDGAA